MSQHDDDLDLPLTKFEKLIFVIVVGSLSSIVGGLVGFYLAWASECWK